MVPLLSTSKADSGLASEFRWDQAIYTAYERMLKDKEETPLYQENGCHLSTVTRSCHSPYHVARPQTTHTEVDEYPVNPAVTFTVHSRHVGLSAGSV